MNKTQVISDFTSGKISRKQASLKLMVTERTITNLARKLKGNRTIGFRHRNSGIIPHNRTEKEFEKLVVDLYHDDFDTWNFTHFHSHSMSHNLLGRFVPLRTLSEILARNKVVSPKAKKPNKPTRHLVSPAKLINNYESPPKSQSGM
jgi:hypothetical protein